MTLSDILLKMLKKNFRRYRLYFMCNVFSIVLFYCFASIFTNKSFMDNRVVNSSISGNIIAPSLLVGIFLMLFIPYSYQAFLKNRKHEYGILMTLGMSEKEIFTNMLLENCIVAGIALICGLALGTVISYAFYFIIRRVIGISGLLWYFNMASYQVTVLLYFVTILLTLVSGLLGLAKMRVTDLIKEKFRAEKEGKPYPGIFFLGLGFVLISVLIMITGYHNSASDTLIASFVLMSAGLCMTVYQADSLEKYFYKLFPGYKEKNILSLSFIRQHAGSGKKVSIIAAWLIGFSVFFGGLCLVSYQSFLSNAVSSSPYDLVYSQIFGKNQVEDKDMIDVLNQKGVTVNSVYQVDFMRNNAYNLLPVSEVNSILHCNYQIREGGFLTVYQFDKQDGYQHDMSGPESVSLQCGADTLELLPAGDDIRILFNWNPTFADMTLVLNDKDYYKIASENKDVWKGVIKLYSFEDWKTSAKGIDAVKNYLFVNNQIDRSEVKYYEATSKIEAYTTAKQSAEFFIFLMLFIVVLFCGASNIMVHFKIKAEAEEEQRMLSGLYRIGVTKDEMLAILQNKNLYYYLPQVLTGLFVGVFYNYAVNGFYGYGWKAAGYSLLFGVVLAVLQFIAVRKYSGRELQGFNL